MSRPPRHVVKLGTLASGDTAALDAGEVKASLGGAYAAEGPQAH